MTETTLSPETLKELEKLADDWYRTWGDTRYSQDSWRSTDCWKQVYARLRAAATVAVEAMQRQIDGWQEDARRCAQTADDWRGRHRDANETIAKLQFELAEARSDLDDCINELDKARRLAGHAVPVYEKTTPEEAGEIIRVWRCTFSDGEERDLVAAAAAIDTLIEKRLPLAPTVAGMTIEERVDDIWSIYKPIGDCHERARMHMTQAVAEAMAAQKSIAESDAECRWQEQLNKAEQRHAKELQEAVAAEREKVHKLARAYKVRLEAYEEVRTKLDSERERHAADCSMLIEGNEGLRRDITVLMERHAAELAQAYSDLNDAIDALDRERANWQAGETDLKKACAKSIDIANHDWRYAYSRAVATAYEEAARKLDELASQAGSRSSYTAAGYCRLGAKAIRELAAKPQEACGACGKAGCTEIHADESDITHDCRPGAYGTLQEDGPDLTQAPDMAAEPRHPMAVCTGAWPETKAWDAFWGIR